MARFGVRSALLTAFLVASGAPVVLFWLWPHSAALNSQFADVEERHLLHAKNAVTAMQRIIKEAESGALEATPAQVMSVLARELDFFWKRVTRAA